MLDHRQWCARLSDDVGRDIMARRLADGYERDALRHEMVRLAVCELTLAGFSDANYPNARNRRTKCRVDLARHRRGIKPKHPQPGCSRPQHGQLEGTAVGGGMGDRLVRIGQLEVGDFEMAQIQQPGTDQFSACTVMLKML